MIFSIKDHVLLGVNDEYAKEIIIPDSIERINSEAFKNMRELKRVVFPDSVKTIEEYAFCNCRSLTEVVFGKGLTRIANNAFSYCCSLSEVNLPECLQNINSRAFAYTALKEISLPDSIRCVADDAFAYTPWQSAQTQDFVMPHPTILLKINCDKESVTVPDGVRYISSNVLINTELDEHGMGADITPKGNVKELILPDSVKVIEDCAFYNSRLRRVHLGNNVRYIGMGAFSGCRELEDINFPESLTAIHDKAFSDTLWEERNSGSMMMVNSHLMLYCDPEAEKIVLPEGIVEIADGAFSRSRAKHIVLPYSLREITSCAFDDCKELRSVVFNDGIEVLDLSDFTHCPSLERLVLPSTLKLSFSAFYMSSLKKLDIELGFTVKESISEVFLSPYILAGPCYIAPHIPISAMDELSEYAAMGFAKCMLSGGRYDDGLADGYKNYIAEHRAKYYSLFSSYPFMLNYMCMDRLIPAEDIEQLLDMFKDDVETTARLLEYSSGLKRTDYEI